MGGQVLGEKSTGYDSQGVTGVISEDQSFPLLSSPFLSPPLPSSLPV